VCKFRPGFRCRHRRSLLDVNNEIARYRRLSVYLLLLALLLVLLTLLLGPDLPLLLMSVVGLASLALLIYSAYRRDLRSK